VLQNGEDGVKEAGRIKDGSKAQPEYAQVMHAYTL
jgi:hypothetical protein